jgi:outer membrane biosynthesis protein TonB
MPARSMSFRYRLAVAFGLALVLAGCTKSGQFDPQELLNSDAFDGKKKLKGDRIPVFPDGVPGTTTGVPADLVKGYQPPPDQTDAATAPPAPAPVAEAKPKPKPKPKPNPAVAVQKPPASTPTRINIGGNSTLGPGTQQQPAQAQWPAPPPTAPGQQAAQPSQPLWPAAPSTGTQQQTAMPSQSIWPNPPATGNTTQ